MRNRLFTCLMVALTLYGCGTDVVYHHFEHVPNGGWEKNDTLAFSVSPISEDGTYHLDIELRSDETYPFMSLTLIINQTVWPRGEQTIHTLSCKLMDQEGTSLGNGISNFQYHFPLTDLQLNEGDSLTVKITHTMKREILPGITDAGIRLVRSGSGSYQRQSEGR